MKKWTIKDVDTVTEVVETVILTPVEDDEGVISMVGQTMEYPDSFLDSDSYSIKNLLKAGISPESIGRVNTTATRATLDKEKGLVDMLHAIPTNNEEVEVEQ